MRGRNSPIFSQWREYTAYGGFLHSKALSCLVTEIFTRKGDDDATGNPSWISRYQLKYHNFPIIVSPVCVCFKYLRNRWERNFDRDMIELCIRYIQASVIRVKEMAMMRGECIRVSKV